MSHEKLVSLRVSLSEHELIESAHGLTEPRFPILEQILKVPNEASLREEICSISEIGGRLEIAQNRTKGPGAKQGLFDNEGSHFDFRPIRMRGEGAVYWQKQSALTAAA
jgi:hypothetical protein